MAPTPKTPRYKYFDPDSDSDADPESLPTVAPPRRNMEFYDTHTAPPPRSSVRKPKSAATSAPTRATHSFVDLTDSPVGTPPLQQQHTGEVSSQISLPSLSQGSANNGGSGANRPLGSSSASNRHRDYSPDLMSFGASIAKKNPKSSSQRSYIKPATPNAFAQYTQPKRQHPLYRQGMPAYQPREPADSGAWPSWVTQNQPFPGLHAQLPNVKPLPIAIASSVPHQPPTAEPNSQEEEVEVFDINQAGITAADYERYQGDADAHMRELLSGAIGDGEEGNEQAGEGNDVIEGFASGVRLMPHQIRGVKWMKGRESGRKYGGILADDMGLGKTVQTLARIVEGAPTAAEKRGGYKGGTLIVAPLAVMEQWASEARSKTVPGRLKVTTHHGPSRAKTGKALEGFDVVITTFQTLASEHKIHEASKPKAKGQAAESEDELDSDGELLVRKVKKTKKPTLSAIYSVKWLRVVIDEAQNIKNKNTNAAKAAVALSAKYRWCLTGTPIQNNVEELFSLFRFLRAKPLDNWEIFRERIIAPMRDNRTGIAMKRLHVILKAIMLRRTKDATIDGKRILNLPKRTVEIVQCPFDTEEREFYNALEQQTALSLNKFVKSGTVMQNYTSVLTMLLRLRQACDHPSLCANALSVDKDAIDNKSAQSNGEVDQADELADLLGGLQMKKEKVCEMCFVKLEDRNETHCEECKDIVHKAEMKAAFESNDDLPPSSAKIRKLLDLIALIEERSERKEKTIVFSQFTSFLDLVGPFLRAKGIKFVRYDGSMRNDLRQESLEAIKSDPSIRVILISFKAGSTGLNLTCCNNVILMDLWWNPALEDQAFDRAHRLGQKLDVNIYKLTIDATVEDRILALQESKRELARAALSGDTLKGVMKLSLADIMALFRTNRGDD